MPEWYARYAEKALGHTPAFLDVAGGAPLSIPATAEDREAHSAINTEIAHAYIQDLVPSYVLNSAFYLLAAEKTHPDHDQAWFPAPDSPHPVVDRVRSLIKTITIAKDELVPKPIPHFVLLPPPAGRAPTEEWRSVGAFASAFKPTLGYDPNIAKLARVVSIAGDEEAISVQVEKDLAAAGCIVHRVPGITKGSLLDTLAVPSPAGARPS
jgi:hypothetical protein